MIFKVDFEKAYDSVRWCYLDDVLKKFGFSDKWCGWIRSCLYSSEGSVIVNGSPTKEFQFHRGLKQGDPLSPFLFLLIMESLHISVQRVVDAGMFRGINIGPSLQLSHLFYADNTIFMGHCSDSNIDTIIYALECFYHASGLRINMNKSKLMGISVSSDKVEQAARKIGCTILNAPFSYLGSKVGCLMSRVQSWNEIISKLTFRLSKWKMKTLSIGAYLNGKKQIWVKWNKVLASKDNGGLGVSSFFALNRALLFKWVWQFRTHQASLWAKVIKGIHDKDGKIGNGEDTLFGRTHGRGITILNRSIPEFPRGGLEEFQYLQLSKDMEDVSLIDMKDRWSWSLDGAGDFSVASVRKMIDNRNLPVVSSKTRWINEVPIKVNILA
ncbi:RNA-directed DNA polymerase, eukaryota, reverse transcriptase zinc-binding domain protein [Tanacetum coccineum]